MKLKGLELQGFKSFPDKTKIIFNRGLTAVVGPNGSGKSNISDAIRWVMGEQSTKTLRGAKMEDVIFTGTKQRKSHGFAEVSLIIDNSDRALGVDSDEVTVTRKYYRTGDSDYMINSSNVRLRDVNELFMDTGLGRDGYALVGQGRIAEIVQSKSDERREIFEEAAGISKLRYKKNEAERKLKASEENMLRLKDILSELEERVGPLKEQSQKAKKFIELADEKKTLEISLWNNTLEKSNKLLKDQSDKIFASQVEYSEIESQIDGIEKQIEDIYASMQECLVNTDNLRNKKSEIEQNTSDTTARIAVLENDILHHSQNIERIKGELASFDDNYDKLVEQLKEKKSLLDKLYKNGEDIDKNMSAVEGELYNLNEQNENVSDYTAQLNNRINELIINQSKVSLTLAQLNEQTAKEKETLENNTLILNTKKEDALKTDAELKDTNELLETLSEKETVLHNTQNGYKLKLDSKLKKLEALESEVNKLSLSLSEKTQSAKLLEDLQKNLEGFAYSVKTVVNRGKNGYLKGILGTVSQLIDVPDEYAVAIETALGGALQNIVTENESSAKAAINYLKNENAGRATFLPLTSVKGTKLDVREYKDLDGYISLACDLVKFEEKYTSVIYSLLGRIVVVDDLDSAVILAKKGSYRFKIVTLDGQVVNAGGSMTGGSKNKSQGILSRKADILKLNDEAKKLEAKLSEKKLDLKELNDEVATLEAYVSSINSELMSINEDKIRALSEQKRILMQIEQEKATLDAMQKELTLLKSSIDTKEKEIVSFTEKLKETENELNEANAQLDKVKGENDTLSVKRDELSENLSSLRMNKLELQKDIEVLKSSISELESRDQSSKDTSQRLILQISELENASSERAALIDKLKGDIENNSKTSKDIDTEISTLMKRRSELEASTTVLRADERKISDKKEKISGELARLEERKNSIEKEYDDIIAKLWEEYQLTRTQANSLAIELENISEAKAKLNSVKNKIKGLGNINLSAIEEYDEVSARYEFLSEQLSDVEKSRAELSRLIFDLTDKMKNIFEESFEKINENFKKIFTELFGGGRAELKLTDSDNILESGIEIFVEPPGKIIKNLSLLSGGEQTFVAIAIYFAILKVRPAPFCVLDEIEAALDDVNVTKYAQYLRSMSDKTQFIMITHRRGTMEEADMLYGVTMQEEGVSKLLALNVSQVEEKLGLKDTN